MRALVRLRLPGGEVRELGPGDIIGRMWSAALPIQDPAVSEAHALVSLRGNVLKLLALRGRFAVDEKSLTELELVVGQRVFLTHDLVLEVVEVVLPDDVLALEGEGLARQVLAGVTSLEAAPRPRLVPGVSPEADAVLWTDGLGWMMRLGREDEVRPLVAGDAFTVRGRAFAAVTMPLARAGQAVTAGVGLLEAPLVIIVRYDTVHIHREVAPSLVLDGISARILSELATINLPVSWEALAKDIWPDDDDVLALRRKWDTSIARLRKKLREHRIRPDLVRADGTGNFEMFLLRGDAVDDQT